MQNDTTLQTLNLPPLPDRQTLRNRLGEIQAALYRIESVAGAAALAVRELKDGEGSDADGCLEVMRDLISQAAVQIDIVHVLAPAETQEVSHVAQ